MVHGDARGLQLIFGSAFAAVYFVFAAMYWHAYRMREALRLSAFEIVHSKTRRLPRSLTANVTQQSSWSRNRLFIMAIRAESLYR